MRITRLAASFALAALTTAPLARAQFTPAWTWNRHDVFVHTTGAITTSRGWEFTVTEPMEVTAIGVYDVENHFSSPGTALSFPGLAQQHEVALFDVASPSSPLATAVVEAGEATPLCQDGYRYAMIAPTTLVPGVNYVVAAYWPGDTGAGDFDPYADTQSSAAPVMTDPRINLVQARHRLGGGPFTFPSSITGTSTTSYIGLLNFRTGSGACEPNPPADLSTTFVGGNGQAGAMFDIRSLSTETITIDSFQINLRDAETNATPVEVTIYWREDSHVGHEFDPAGWMMLGQVDVLSWGDNRRTPVPIGGLVIAPGHTAGIFITTGFETGMPPPASPPALNYSNIPPSTGLYASADLEITGGVGKANPPFIGDTFPNRMFNGAVRYTVGASCYADCDGSSALDIFDFLCFQDAFVQMDPYANCDGNAAFDIFDFLCFQDAFVVGCP